MARTYQMLVSTVLNKARKLLNDANSLIEYRNTDSELIGHLNDALSMLANVKPGLFAVTADYTCVAGYKQVIEFARAIQLLEVVGIPECERTSLAQFSPGWMSGSSGPTLNWIRSPAEPLRFDVYPPAAVDAVLPVLYSQSPAPLAATTDVIQLSENYEPALVDFIVGRAEMKDDEHVNSTRAAQMMTRFLEQVKGLA